VEPCFHGAHAACTRVFVGQAPKQVVEQSFAQCTLRNAQVLDAQPIESFQDDRESAGQHFLTLRREALELDARDVSGAQHLLQQPLETGALDVRPRGFVRSQHVADRAHGA
jgi:hypothetical protein